MDTYTIGQEVLVGRRDLRKVVAIVRVVNADGSILAKPLGEHESIPALQYSGDEIAIPTPEELKKLKAAKFRFRAKASGHKRDISEIGRAIPDKFEVAQISPSRYSDQDVIVTLVADGDKWSPRAMVIFKNYRRA